MGIKVIFVGNSISGDDGIGPFLYNELKNEQKLSNYQLLELGVIGFDMISYISEEDKLIIVDAVYDEKKTGEVVLLDEKDLSKDISVVSMHDFGVEQTSSMIRSFMPGIRKISVVGICIKRPKVFSTELSSQLKSRIPEIKEKVIKYIRQ
ncbi:hydrogenase maturation protease, partial [Candidatus Woesearchaeota archaeon]|nr:hydrogenase maturation protease [Candidatus Woesearchaeota archaeon]